MATPQETIWDIEPHTVAKHEILRRYLQAWFPILNKYHGRVVYIDGFCGPGRYRGGEPGSPIIALDVARSHIVKLSGELVFWFIDEREDRIDHLKHELETINIPKHFKVQTVCGMFHEVVGDTLQALELEDASLAPTFAFVDPFGFKGIPFTLISHLLSQKRCEVLVTFSIDSINRFLEHPRDAVVRHIADAFGTDECFEIAERGVNRIDELRLLYQRQLLNVARFVRFFEMKDMKNRLVYLLFFASNHPRGFLKMKEAMWAVDLQGTFTFSDATDPDQRLLFQDFDETELVEMIAAEFKGKGIVTGKAVRLWVEEETQHYINKHKTAALKFLAANASLEIEALKTDGSRWKGGFPDTARLRFLE